MNNKILLKTNNLKKYFPVKNFMETKKHFVKAVDDVSIEIYEGETFGLVGESGCGKSTLGRTLIRMYDVTEGDIFYQQKNIAHLKAKDLKEYKNKMQIIFQDPYSSLNPNWNLEEIVSEPLKLMNISKNEIKDRVIYLVNKVGLKGEDMKKFPFEFSGGQRQRIGIARALSVNPEFVMCDEPISALDVSIQAQIVNMLEDLQSEFKLTYLFAAHDLSMVKYISNRIGVMYLGRMVEICSSQTLYSRPLHPYSKALLSAIPIADPKLAAKTERIILDGELPSPMSNSNGCNFSSRCRYATEVCREEHPKLIEVEQGHFVACFNL